MRTVWGIDRERVRRSGADGDLVSSLKFGTSGLRGLVTDLVGGPSYAYASAFFRSVSADDTHRAVCDRAGPARQQPRDRRHGGGGGRGRRLHRDRLRRAAHPGPGPRSDAARRLCGHGHGSHIPEDRNGLKFYRPDGEITKADEVAILAALADIPAGGERPAAASATPEPDAITRYQQRYAAAFAPDILKGLRIAVYQQSSVARDLLSDLLAAFGAQVTPIGRSQVFVPIDTEAHRPEDIAFIRDVMASGVLRRPCDHGRRRRPAAGG